MGGTIYIGSIAQERVGPVWIALSSSGLVGLHMRTDEAAMRHHYQDFDVVIDAGRTRPLLEQLEAYFGGDAREFDTPIDWTALTTFQSDVLKLVSAIPYGQTSTYQDIALELGQPGAARAVGRANATNPMPIVNPCHRVLGADGRLHGYGGPGGVETKAWLLKLEGSRLI